MRHGTLPFDPYRIRQSVSQRPAERAPRASREQASSATKARRLRESTRPGLWLVDGEPLRRRNAATRGRFFAALSSGEAAGFADACPQAIDHGGDGIVGYAADDKDHQGRFARRIGARGDADALNTMLLQELAHVSRVYNPSAIEFGLCDAVDGERIEDGRHACGHRRIKDAVRTRVAGCDDARADALQLRRKRRGNLPGIYDQDHRRV